MASPQLSLSRPRRPWIKVGGRLFWHVEIAGRYFGITGVSGGGRKRYHLHRLDKNLRPQRLITVRKHFGDCKRWLETHVKLCGYEG